MSSSAGGLSGFQRPLKYPRRQREGRPPPTGLFVALTVLSVSDAFCAPTCAAGDTASRVPLASGNNDSSEEEEGAPLCGVGRFSDGEVGDRFEKLANGARWKASWGLG